MLILAKMLRHVITFSTDPAAEAYLFFFCISNIFFVYLYHTVDTVRYQLCNTFYHWLRTYVFQLHLHLPLTFPYDDAGLHLEIWF